MFQTWHNRVRVHVKLRDVTFAISHSDTWSNIKYLPKVRPYRVRWPEARSPAAARVEPSHMNEEASNSLSN